MKRPIFLDYAATTPVDPRVAKEMINCLELDGNFGNPASRSHVIGWQAEAAVEAARSHVAKLIGANPREIVWTSGATESDNLAIKGIAESLAAKGKHIITSAIEHKAVLDSCDYLSSKGFEITKLQPDSSGRINPDQVEAALRNDTILVSIMHVNNEIGVVNPVAEIGEICRRNQVVFHVDGAQSAAKVAIDVVAMNIDLLSISAHKMYGPKGIGALYVRRAPEVKVAAQIHGGGHERGMRSGTLPTHQIVGFGEAARIASAELAQDRTHASLLQKAFLAELDGIEGIHVNGSMEHRSPMNLNLSFAGVDGESLLMSLNRLAVSSGSACNSASVDPSFVLVGIGVPAKLALTSLRFSFGRFSTKEEVVEAAKILGSVYTSLRG
ncbi:IscS subfamily cysteine desulfurase [Umboniibacter marinipuniceus]|uniref:cysteine desulfurase n=1 Tax=Umboniibacter marinipuniceus TaxID=569599 RepID=A0A3M0A5N6_9GAMM|nr:IscS subfamily cysteine desulfurase [Umboniibacter marinipuniceus]RMA79926.1 cysteine desulfurase IscS [Umboniibacter marinipuniceus]